MAKGMFEALFPAAQRAVSTPAQAQQVQPLAALVASPEWQQGSIAQRKELYNRWKTEVAAPALTAQAAVDKKAKTVVGVQARQALREFEKREFRKPEGGILFDNDLMDLMAQGLAGSVGSMAKAGGVAFKSPMLKSFGESTLEQAQGMAGLFSDATLDKQAVAQERTTASRRDQLLADTKSPLNAPLLDLGRKWGGVARIPASSPELRALTDEYDRTGGTSLLPEVATAGRNFLGAPLDATMRAVGSSVLPILGGALGGVPGAVVGGALVGAGQGADAYDQVKALTDEAIMANPDLAARVQALGGGAQAVDAVREDAARTASMQASAMNAVIAGGGAAVGARFGAERMVTRGGGGALGGAAGLLRTGAIETGSEGVEGGLNQFTTNMAVAGADPTQALSAGVAPAAVEEGLAGAGMTGFLAPFNRPAPPQPVPPPTAPPLALPAPGGPTVLAADANGAVYTTPEQQAAAEAEAFAQQYAPQPVTAAAREADAIAALTAGETAVAPAAPTLPGLGDVGVDAADLAASPAPFTFPDTTPTQRLAPVVPRTESAAGEAQAVAEASDALRQAAGLPITGQADPQALALIDRLRRETAPPPPAPPPPPPPLEPRGRSEVGDAAAVEDALDAILRAAGLPTVERTNARAEDLVRALTETTPAAPRSAEQQAEFMARFNPALLSAGALADATTNAARIITSADTTPAFRDLLQPLTLIDGGRTARTSDGGDAVFDGAGAADGSPAEPGGGRPGPDAQVPAPVGDEAGGNRVGAAGLGDDTAAGPGGAAAGQERAPEQRPAPPDATPAGDGGTTAGAVPQGAGVGPAGASGGTDGQAGGSGPAATAAEGSGRATRDAQAGGRGGQEGGAAGGVGGAGARLTAEQQRALMRLEEAYLRAKAAKEAHQASKRSKPSPRARALGTTPSPAAVRDYEERVKAWGAWSRKDTRLAKDVTTASNARFSAFKEAGLDPLQSLEQQKTRPAPDQSSLFQQTVTDGTPISREAAAALERNDLGATLEDLSQTASTPFLRAVAARLQGLLAGVTQVQITPGMTRPDGTPVFGGASVDGTVVAFNPDFGVAEETVLHESTHAALERSLRAPAADLTAAQQEARGQLAKLWRAAKAKEKVAAAMSPEAMNSLSEFAAEAMTNTDLQVALDAQPYQLGTAWERFKNHVLTLLGLGRRDTMLGATTVAVDTLFTRPSTVVRTAEGSAQTPPSAPTSAEEGAAENPDILFATSIGSRAAAAVRGVLSRSDRVRSEEDFLAAGTPGGTPARPVNLSSLGDAMVRTFVDHRVEAYNLIDAEARAVPALAALWDRVKDGMRTWRNRSDAYFETHKGSLIDPYYARLAALTKSTGRRAEDIHAEAGAVAQARHALDRTTAAEKELQDTLARAQERVAKFEQLEAALRQDTTDKVGALVARLRIASEKGIDGAAADRLISDSLLAVSDIAAALEKAGVVVPRFTALLEGLDAMAVQAARGRNAVDAVMMVRRTLDKVHETLGDRPAADRALEKARGAWTDWQAAQANAPVMERGPDGTMVQKVLAPLPGGLRRSVIEQKLASASPEAQELATVLRDAFRALTDLAVEQGAVSERDAAFYRQKFPNYVSFMGDSDRDVSDLVGLSPNRAFLDEAEGAQTVGQPAPPLVALIAKLHHLGNVVGSGDVRRDLLALAMTQKSSLVKMAEGQGEKGAARLTVNAEVGGKQVRARIALMDSRLSSGLLETPVLEGTVRQSIAKATGLFGRLVTQYVPTFAPINLIRDSMTRAFNFVGRQELKPAQVNQVRAAFAAHLTNPANWAEVWQFVRTGEPTGNLRVLRDAGALLLFTDSQVSETKVGAEVARRNATWPAALRRGGAAVELAVHRYNRLFEAIVPLATFRALRAAGLTEAKAAAVTTDMMDFRARGNLTPEFNAAFPFFAAAAQDAKQVAHTLMPGGKPNLRAWGEMAALAGIAAVLYGLGREADEDDEFGGKAMDALTTDHERNWVLPVGDGTFVKVPIGFGIVQLAWNMGVNSARVANGTMGAQEGALSVAKSMWKALTPTGVSEVDFGKDPAGALLMTLTPGLAKPIVQAASNKNFAGGKLTYADREKNFLSEQGREATQEAYKTMATAWREATGMDLAPEIVRVLVEGYMVGPLTALTALTADTEDKGLAKKGFGGDVENALAKAAGVNRLLRPLSPEQEVSTKAYARMEEARQVLRQTNANEPAEVDQESQDEVLDRVMAAGGSAEEVALVEAYLEYKKVDNSLRRQQGKLRGTGALGEFETQRLEAMRELLYATSD